MRHYVYEVWGSRRYPQYPYYIGYTSDLEQRSKIHGKPVTVISECCDITSAYMLEGRLKKQAGLPLEPRHWRLPSPDFDLTVGSNKGGNTTKERGVGIFGMDPEYRSQVSKECGLNAVANQTGIHDPEKARSYRVLGGKARQKLFTPEQRKQRGKNGAKGQHSQRWRCLDCGLESTPTGVIRHSKSKGHTNIQRIK